LRAHPPETLAQRTELAEVPFFPQEEYQCGPAALASVLVHNNIATTPAALVPQVYLPGREGSLQTEMLAATRRHGLVAYHLAPRIEDLLTEVAAGNPVIVLQNLAFSFAPLWHYAVVVGYDRGQEEIVLAIRRDTAADHDVLHLRTHVGPRQSLGNGRATAPAVAGHRGRNGICGRGRGA